MNDMTITEMSPSDVKLTVSRRIAAPPARIYDAWLDPKMLIRFMSNCKGMALSEAEIDPRVEGRFLMTMRVGDKDYPHTGTYLTLTPHSRIAFTWESASSTFEGSTVTLDLVADGDATLLTLTHARFSSEGVRDGHAGAWTTILDGMVTTKL